MDPYIGFSIFDINFSYYEQKAKKILHKKTVNNHKCSIYNHNVELNKLAHILM